MTETFTASNGLKVIITDNDVKVEVRGLTPRVELVVDALKEWAASERDQELGRWRWPENPDYVVYKAPAGERVPDARHVTVSNESNGEAAWLFEVGSGGVSGGDSWARDAARAYFAAHPEPKPWHDAKPGEAWVITYGGDEHAVISDGSYFLWEAGSEQPIDDSRITDGRRIYPEVAHG